MAWLALFVLAVVVSAAGALLPRRARFERAPGFPWFWVVFPVTCMAIAAAVGVFVCPQAVTGSGSFWWDAPRTSSPATQFLSGEQYQRFVLLRRLRRVLPAVSAVGIGMCVWAWRRRRL
ncbi:amino acid permease [Prescottella agglutinans]|uniref:Amino acid permease n=1 Tax=Prescottella agglutinans TaxID=1644129 RepID=A0A3S3AI95_9NOCA|nr:amino acid permease [Prescottella agglutinans]